MEINQKYSRSLIKILYKEKQAVRNIPAILDTL